MKTSKISAWLRQIRIHQWLKNLLIFVPAIAGHHVSHPGVTSKLLLAFVAFSLASSSVYLLNDLYDLDNDRQHVSKRSRPLAAGSIGLASGVLAAFGLLCASLLVSIYLGPNFLAVAVAYVAITFAYSSYLKRLVMVDVLVLASLYAIRVVAGAVVVSIPLTFWILAFSIFLFLSLALVKRYSELHNLAIQELITKTKLNGRGYSLKDMPLIQSFGASSGVASVIVLALYVNSPQVAALYKTSEMIWLEIPVVMTWLMWVWLKASRGEMHEDPIIFATRDKISLTLALIFATVFVLAVVVGN